MSSHPRLEELVTAIGVEKVVELADYAPEDKTWVPALIEACKYSKPRNRKAACVLHHIFLRHTKLIEPKVEALIDVLHASEDGSVHRELLKILVEIKINELEWVEFSPLLFDLGVGILFDEAQTKGMHYIAIRLAERFMNSEKERIDAVDAIKQMLFNSYTGEKSMCNAADKAMKRIEKRKISITKS